MSKHGSQPESPSQDGQPTASKPLTNIGVKTSVNGRLSPKSPPLFGWPLLARITSKGPLPETLTSQCLMSTTSYSPELTPEDKQELNHTREKSMTTKKTLMERLGVNGLFPEADPQHPNVANLTSPCMHGKSKKKSHLPLSL